jgi:dipeptidase D
VTDLLANLEPKPLWRYFLELSRIPRASKQEAAAAAWVVAQARALGCQVEQDRVGNILIRKAASPGREGRPVVAMQAHVDMVCEKNEGTAHDFSRSAATVTCCAPAAPPWGPTTASAWPRRWRCWPTPT